jgi:hypothetical protein
MKTRPSNIKNGGLTLEYLERLKPSYIAKNYPVPKWIQFSEELISDNWHVRLHRSKSTVSKYLYISKNNKNFKIRFSNHKPNKMKENNEDCDFYVGIGNRGVITTSEVLEILKSKA